MGMPPLAGPVIATPVAAVTEPVVVIVVGLTESVMPCVMAVEMISDMIAPGLSTRRP